MKVYIVLSHDYAECKRRSHKTELLAADLESGKAVFNKKFPGRTLDSIREMWKPLTPSQAAEQDIEQPYLEGE